MFNDYHIRCRNDIKQTIIIFCNNTLFEVADVAANDDYIDIADSDDIVDGFAYAMLMLSQMLLLLSLMKLLVLEVLSLMVLKELLLSQ